MKGEIDMRAEVTNYENENNVDFTIYVETTFGEEIRLFIQPRIEEGEITDITTRDSQDDSWLLSYDATGDAIKAMKKALDEYKGCN